MSIIEHKKTITHNVAKKGINKFNHNADAYRKNSDTFDPMDNKKANMTAKQTLLKYKKLKPGMLLLIPKKVIKEVGENMNIYIPETMDSTKNEPVFEVLMAGKIDPTYDLVVKTGDLIMLSKVTGFKHLNHTKVIDENGKQIPGFYTAASRDIIAIVEYSKLTPMK